MNKDLKLEIGERVRQARKSVGFSRDELSELLGISSLFLSYIECGQRGMSIETLKNLCQALNVSSDYILFGKEKNLNSNEEILKAIESIDEEYHDVVLDSINNLKRTIVITQHINKSKP